MKKILATVLFASGLGLAPPLAQAEDAEMHQSMPVHHGMHHHHHHWMHGGNYHHSGTRGRLNRGANPRHPEGPGNPTNGE